MWLRGIADLARGVAQLVYPNACLICDALEAQVGSFRHGVCSECHHSVTTDSPDVCPKCTATVGPHTDVSQGCMACRTRSFAFDSGIRLGTYRDRLKDAVLRMKSARGEALAEMAGRMFVVARQAILQSAAVNVVIPIPLHWRIRWNRSYNQAEAIAREVATALGAECRPNWLKRVKPTVQHAQPSAAAREANIRGAFRAGRSASLASKTVLLVDDVMTTGSTVAEAARVLKAAGAARVIVAVLARA